MAKSPLKQHFKARASGWVGGRRVEADEVIELTAAEARYEPVDPVAADPAPKRRVSQEAPGS